MTDRLKKLLKRTASALVLGALALVAVVEGGIAYVVMLTFVAALVLHEWRTVARAPSLAVVAGIILAVAASTWLIGEDEDGVAFALALASLALAAAGARLAARSLLWSLAGAAYVLAPALSLAFLRETGFWPVIWLFAVVWAADIGGWLFGSTLRGPRLWPSVSPNKHWSGLVGGLVLSGIVAVALALAAGSALPPVAAGLAGVFVSLAAQMGDLGESAWKRHFNVKDSGAIIPGHGGVMDRIDSLIAASVAMAISVELTGTTI